MYHIPEVTSVVFSCFCCGVYGVKEVYGDRPNMDCGRGMFCPFCGKHMNSLTRFCFTCGRCLEFLKDADKTETLETQGTSRQPDSAMQKQPCPSYKQFMEYRSSKSKERQSFNYGPKGRYRPKERKHVQINVGLMVPSGTDLKPLRGKTLQLFTDPEVAAPDLLKQAVQKMTTFNKDMHEGPYVLLYPDCSEVVHVPGSERPFKLAEYKKEIGKAYSRITFFICLENTIKEWMIPQTLILKLSSQQGAQLNSIVLTLWFLNHKIEVLPNTSWTMKEMHQDNQQFSLDR
ncbi:uncharacterized protein LOC121574230 [Coregonus clupeaformis]|uniref:uncharacterized protein LOC121574230 n=1 Tax=Coregonus clupeaformis TaxID=59861 RepID=UPI001E1C9844|nr:uncharacterized protein LOC121574230 [Coregonus clupeaformis]